MENDNIWKNLEIRIADVGVIKLAFNNTEISVKMDGFERVNMPLVSEGSRGGLKPRVESRGGLGINRMETVPYKPSIPTEFREECNKLANHLKTVGTNKAENVEISPTGLDLNFDKYCGD